MRSLPLFAVLAGRAAGDRPAALRRATGIDATEAIWGAPFRELAALYGGAPPAAALGDAERPPPPARVAMTDPVRPHRRTDVQWSTEAAGWSRASRAA